MAGTSVTDYSSLWGLSEYCSKKQLEFKENGLQDRHAVVPVLLEPQLKKRKIGAEGATDDIVEMQCSFLRSLYTSDVDLPKTKLLNWARARGLKHPTYTTQQEDKLFKSVVTLDGKKYSSSYWYVEAFFKYHYHTVQIEGERACKCLYMYESTHKDTDTQGLGNPVICSIITSEISRPMGGMSSEFVSTLSCPLFFIS